MRSLGPFLTGSHAYGVPGPASDIDLVVFVTEPILEKLKALSEVGSHPMDPDYRGEVVTESLRFGKLNLLCCVDPNVFDTWRTITRELLDKAPVVRHFAVEYMAKRRQELMGVKGD